MIDTLLMLSSFVTVKLFYLAGLVVPLLTVLSIGVALCALISSAAYTLVERLWYYTLVVSVLAVFSLSAIDHNRDGIKICIDQISKPLKVYVAERRAIHPYP